VVAGPTIASAEVDVDLDGSGMPRQAKQIAQTAGKALGKELVPYGKKAGEDTGDAFGEGFGDSTDKHMQDVGRSAARQVESSFRVDSEGIAKRFSNQLEDNTVQEMRVIGEKAGTSFGRGFQVDGQGIAHDIGDSTGKELVPAFRTLGGHSAEAYAQGFGEEGQQFSKELVLFAKKAGDTVVWRKAGGEAGGGFSDGVEDEASPKRMSRLSKILLRTIGKADEWNDAGKGAGGSFSSGFGGGALSGMDRTVALVIKLIAAIGPQMAALGSALSANVVAILSSTLMGLVGALSALVPVGIAAAGGLFLVISAMDDMKAKTPGLSKAIDGVSAAWERQSDAVANQLGPSLRDFLTTLTGIMNNSGFGEAIGSSIALITQAFTDVLNSPGMQGFVTEMTEVIPSALTGFGTGVAKLLEALLTFFGQVGPLAANLGSDFAKWASGIADAANEAASNGSLQKFFDDAYNSIKALMGVLTPLAGALWNVFQAGQGSGDNLLGTLGRLAQKFEDWTNSLEGQSALDSWFSGAEGIFDSLLSLIGVVGTTLADMVTPQTLAQVQDFMGALEDIIPIVGEVLSTIGKADTLNLFANIILGLLKAIEPLLPVLGTLASLIGSIPADVIQTLAVAIAGVAVAFAALLGAGVVVGIITGVVDILAVLAALIPVLAPAIGALGTVIAVLGGPITLIIAIVAALVAGLTYFFTQTETGKKAWAGFVSFLTGLWNGLLDFFTGTVLPIFESIWAGITAGVQAVGDFFGSVWQAILDAPSNVVAWFTGTFVPFFQSLPGLLLEGLIAYVSFWIALPGRIIGALATLIAFLIQWGADAAVALIGWVADAVPKVIQFFADLPGNIIAAVDAFGAMLLDWITTAWNAMYDFVVNGFIAYITFWAELPGKVLAAIAALLPLIGAFFTTLWANIVSSVTTGIENTLKFFRELPGKIISALGSLLGSIGRVFTDAMGEGNRAALEGIGKLLTTMGEIPGKILTAVGDLSKTLYNAGRNIVQGLVDGVGSMAGAVGRKVNEIIGGLSSGVKKLLGISSPSKVFAEIGKNVMLGLGQGITVNASAAGGAMDNVARDLMGTRFGTNAPGFAGGNTRTTSTGRTLSVAPGAIVVNVPTEDPEQAANAVLDRLVARWK
jgi:hypothetical protein